MISSPPPLGSGIERIIREAMERGEFDDLPGMGDPLPDAGIKDDPWVRKWVERNRQPWADSQPREEE